MGIITAKTHTIIGLIVGIILLFAPMLFGFSDNSAATLSAIIVGIFIIANELITTSPVSPLKLVPMKIHIVLDVVTGLFLALSPWLFNFMNSDRPEQWVPHLVVGIMVIGYALLTNANTRTKSIVE